MISDEEILEDVESFDIQVSSLTPKIINCKPRFIKALDYEFLSL